MTVAPLGTGLLGAAIGQRLLEQGTRVQAWNRSLQRLQPLEAHGAICCSEPLQALQGCDWVITVLSDGAATRAVLQRCRLQGQRVLQMATIAPSESRELGAAIGADGGALHRLTAREAK